MVHTPTIDVLLNLAAERPELVLEKLQAFPDLAKQQDRHGYSLVHAAASYGHVELLKALINEFLVNPNIKDEDGETALFSVEDVTMAKELLELGTDPRSRNDEDQTAADKLADDDEQPDVAAYLRELVGASVHSTDGSASLSNGKADEAHHPPPLPEGLQLNIGTMMPEEEAADPEFRRRIEELAARSDFETEEGQQELRNIIMDALSGSAGGDLQGPPTSRRRVE